MKQTAQEVLAALLADEDFKRIPAIAGQFNIFDAVGMASQEIRHSTFLAFLLNPNESHGLGDAFLRAFLQAVFTDNIKEWSIAEDWFLGDAQVDREWQHIDIRVRLPREKAVLVIENKVWSGEHSNQLERYYEAAGTHHPGWRVLPVYLTPGGSVPSDARYKAVRYSTLVEIIENLQRTSKIGDSDSDAQVLLRHYVRLVRNVSSG